MTDKRKKYHLDSRVVIVTKGDSILLSSPKNIFLLIDNLVTSCSQSMKFVKAHCSKIGSETVYIFFVMTSLVFFDYQTRQQQMVVINVSYDLLFKRKRNHAYTIP